MNIIIFGPPGSGKGTQARKLADRYGIPHISTGRIFRAAMKDKSGLGNKIARIMKSGGYVPDDITIGIVKKRLEDADCAEGFILDGFPRTLPQAEALDEFSHVDFVIVLDIPDKVAVERIAGRRTCSKCRRPATIKEGSKCKECGGKLVRRPDESDEVIPGRLKIYHDATHPLLEYYLPRDIVHVIDGTKPVEEAFKDILKVLGDANY